MPSDAQSGGEIECGARVVDQRRASNQRERIEERTASTISGGATHNRRDPGLRLRPRDFADCGSRRRYYTHCPSLIRLRSSRARRWSTKRAAVDWDAALAALHSRAFLNALFNTGEDRCRVDHRMCGAGVTALGVDLGFGSRFQARPSWRGSSIRSLRCRPSW